MKHYTSIDNPNIHISTVDQIARIITKEFESAPSPTIIAIGGPGGVGKSSFSKALSIKLGDSCTVIKLDDYKIDRNEKLARNVSGPAPSANKMQLIIQHLKQLKEHKNIEKPCYNQLTGYCDTLEIIEPSDFIILDGEISTYPHFSDFVDFSLFIDSHWKTQLKTRTERDIDERGYSIRKAVETFIKSNIEEFNEFGANSKSKSDIQLWCEDDYSIVVSAVEENLYQKYSSTLALSNSEISLEKLFVAITTPFNRNQEIDYNALVNHISFLENSGINAIFLAGTTGEFETLTKEEKTNLLRVARNHFSGLIVFNVSSTSIKEAIELVKIAEKYGANAIASLPPFYKANLEEEGIVTFFNTLSQSTSLPLIIYNFSEHTQNKITPRIVNQVDAIAIKDSDKNIEMAKKVALYISASDSIMLQSIEHGAKGAVSVQANYRPQQILVLFNQARNSNENLENLQKEISSASAIFKKNKQIARIKYALSLIVDQYPPFVRIPLVELTEEEKTEIKEFITNAL